MKIRATRISAFTVGATLAALLTLNDIYHIPQSPAGPTSAIFELLLTVAFFGTMTLFVVGLDYVRCRRADVLRTDYMKAFRQVGARMLYWFVGAASTGIALHFVLVR